MNKVAIVTGASGGIGSEIAKSLARENIFVIIHYNHGKAKAQKVKEEILADGYQAEIMSCDIANFTEC